MVDCEKVTQMLAHECEATLNDIRDARQYGADAEKDIKKLHEMHQMLMEGQREELDACLKKEELRLKKAEANQKKEEFKKDQRGRAIDRCITVAGIVIPLGVQSFWMAQEFKFEDNGFHSCKAFKWVTDHFRIVPKK